MRARRTWRFRGREDAGMDGAWRTDEERQLAPVVLLAGLPIQMWPVVGAAAAGVEAQLDHRRHRERTRPAVSRDPGRATRDAHAD